MSNKTVLLLLIAAIVAIAIALFQYYVKVKSTSKNQVLFAFLRFLSVFILLVLLINPSVQVVTTSVEKPNLVILADQSSSIAYLNQSAQMEKVVTELKSSKSLNERFDVDFYGFGSTVFDTLGTPEGKQTRINYALKNIQKVHRKANTAVVVLTDGNQTFGADYAYYKSQKKQPLYAMAFGDTTAVEDVSITRVNANRYTYLDNQFPVEVQVNYQGTTAHKLQLKLFKGKTLLQTTALQFNTTKKSHFANFEVVSKTPGSHTYTVEISPFKAEKNTQNNSRSFVVETIDQKTKILLVSAIKHPDIAALKRSIESNKRRELSIKTPGAVNSLEDYQMLIYYQPKSNFKKVFDMAAQANMQSLTITGKQTDWNFLNRQGRPFKKSPRGQVQEMLPVLNDQFEIFTTDQFNLEKYPPLETAFGSEQLKGDFETLLFKKIGGVLTKQPLLSFWNVEDNVSATLFGEGIWKWRMQNFKNQEDFKNFDDFFGKVIQYLSSNKKRRRLSVDFESTYYANTPILIRASYFNKSFEFDNAANLTITVINEANANKINLPMVLRGQFYEVDLSNLTPDNYSFSISANGGAAKANGSFSILDFDIEKQYYNANLPDLKQLVSNNKGQLFFPDQTEKLVATLENDATLTPVQNSKSEERSLISWKYLLLILILLLGTEWFIRKYKGLI